MVRENVKNKLPSQMAWFLIIATIPQILGLGNGFVDMALKLLTLGVFALVTIKAKDVANMHMFFIGYVFLYAIRCVATFFINKVGMFSAITEILTTLALFFLFYEKPRSVKNISDIDLMDFYRIYACFMLVAGVYNLLTNFGSFINPSAGAGYLDGGAKSFFDNKNTLGMFMLFGSAASMILSVFENEKKWTYVTLFFIANEIAAQCRTAMILSMVMMVLALLSDRGRRGRRLFSVFAIVGTIFLLMLIVPRFGNFFSDLFSDTDSLDARNLAIENMMPLANGKYFWVGYGSDKSNVLAYLYTGNRYFHNTYLYALISGGVFKLILHLVSILIAVRYSLRCFMLDKIVGSLYIIVIASYCVYSYFESFLLFNSAVISMVATIFMVSMPVLHYNALRLQSGRRHRKNG